MPKGRRYAHHRGVIGFASLMLAAGSETTMNLIGSAVIAMLERPEAMARVQSDPKQMIPKLIEETLRFDSPIQLLMRLTMQDVALPTGSIPKGRMVMPLLASANRDEDQFSNSELFDLDRDTHGHVAFGLGNHFRLGAALARLEARCALEVATDVIERHGSFLARGPKALPVLYTPAWLDL